MELYPHVTDAKYAGGYRIEIEFSDGAVKVVDFEKYIRKGGIFAPLADMEHFKSFFIDLSTICWPNGADIAPERLYEEGVASEEGARPNRKAGDATTHDPLRP